MRQKLAQTWNYIQERRASFEPLSKCQGIITRQLIDFDAMVEADRLICLQALWLKDKRLPRTGEAAMSKWWKPLLSDVAINACLLIHRRAGYSKDLDI